MQAPASDDRSAASLTEDGRYRLLVEAVTDYAIFMLDADGFVTSWNAGARRFKGYEAPEILGEHFSRFYTEEDCRAGRPKKSSRRQRGRANSRVKVGGCARMGPDFGRASSSIA